MDEKTLSKLERGGALSVLPSGQTAVRVSLHLGQRLAEPSRLARRHLLEQAFETIAKKVAAIGGQVALDTLAVSAQTVEALVPADRYDDAVAALESLGVRVDPVIFRQVV